LSQQTKNELVGRRFLGLIVVSGLVFSALSGLILSDGFGIIQSNESAISPNLCENGFCKTNSQDSSPKTFVQQGEDVSSSIMTISSNEIFTDLKLEKTVMPTREYEHFGNKSTLFAEKDSFIREGLKETNEGSNKILRVMGSGPTNNRSLVTFSQDDIEAVLDDKNLESATIKLFVVSNDGNWNLNGWHEFSTLDEGLSFNVTSNRISEEKPIIANLIWDVGLGDVADFDLVLVDPLGQIVDYSANEQSTKNDTPLEYIQHIPETEGIYALGIIYNGENNSPSEIPDAMIEIFTPSDELEYPVPQGSVSVPSDAAGAIVVGAVNHMTGQLEPFSSQGPTNNGKLAPHLVGPDGVTTSALDGEPFFGTSATAPYIAGIAALLLETNPDISSDQILTKLQQNTTPSLFSIQTDYDNSIGYGPANALFLTLEEVVG